MVNVDPPIPENCDVKMVFWGYGHMAMSNVDVKDCSFCVWRGICDKEEALGKGTPVTREGRGIDLRVDGAKGDCEGRNGLE